jgi:small subunit ribosomal protein S18
MATDNKKNLQSRTEEVKEEKTVTVQNGKKCPICANEKLLDWKAHDKLWDFLTVQGRIQSKEYTNVCAYHQRQLAKVIKHARHLALLPFTTLAEK